MKTPLAGVSALALAGFALCTTGCVTEYQTVSSVPVYSGTTLPAASRVALVMEFRGGTPTAQEREEVRAILADYLAGKGSVLVDEPSGADYLVHAVLERRNAENPAEWTVVNTYSAHSLAAVGGDDYRWPGGIIEDDYYDTTTFTYVGFGAFYPVWFDAWDSPWYRGRVASVRRLVRIISMVTRAGGKSGSGTIQIVGSRNAGGSGTVMIATAGTTIGAPMSEITTAVPSPSAMTPIVATCGGATIFVPAPELTVATETVIGTKVIAVACGRVPTPTADRPTPPNDRRRWIGHLHRCRRTPPSMARVPTPCARISRLGHLRCRRGTTRPA